MAIPVGGPAVTASFVVIDPNASVAQTAPEAAAVYIEPVVSVSAVQPNTSVTYVEPQLGIVYVLPIFAISYIELNQSVYVDDSGLYQYKTDFFAVADIASITTVKGFSDSFFISDASTNDTGKGLSDGFSLADTFSYTAAFTRGLADSLSLADSGTLLSQGYCDVTYFAEDYVGDSRTF